MAKAKQDEKKSDLVKVKILKHVMAHKPDDIVEVSEEMARHLCYVNVIDDGISKKEIRRAIRLEDSEKINEAILNDPNMTAAEAKALGVKNVVNPEAYNKSMAKAMAQLPEVAPSPFADAPVDSASDPEELSEAGAHQ